MRHDTPFPVPPVVKLLRAVVVAGLVMLYLSVRDLHAFPTPLVASRVQVLDHHASPDSTAGTVMTTTLEHVTTPKACWDTLMAARNAAFDALRAKPGAVVGEALTQRLAEIDTVTVRSARLCVNRLDFGKARTGDEFSAFLALYRTAGDDIATSRAYDRYAQFLVDSMLNVLTQDALQHFTKDPVSPARRAIAEHFVKRLDASKSAALDRYRVTAHRIMSYQYPPKSAMALRHARLAYQAARRIPLDERPVTSEYADGVIMRATRAMDEGNHHRAVAELRTAIAAVGEGSVAGQALREVEQRYALIGTRAPAITNVHWLNNPGAPAQVTFGTHNATLFVVTAPWCSACKLLDPVVEKIGDAYRDLGVQTIFVAPLEGDSATTTVAQAVEGYRRQMKLGETATLPTAIVEGEQKVGENGTLSWSEPAVFKQYHTAFPSAYIVDRAGVIRHMQIGYGPRVGNEIRAALDKVLGTSKKP